MGKTVKKPTRRRWLFFTGIGLAALLLISGGFAAIFMAQLPLQKVAIANLEPQRNIQTNQLKPAVENAIGNYKLGIKYPYGSTKEFSLSEIGISVDIDKTLAESEAVITNSRLLERLAWWKTVTIPLVLQVDTSALSAFINAHAIQASSPATNAQLKIENGMVSITPEKPGQGQAIPNATRAITNAAAGL